MIRHTKRVESIVRPVTLMVFERLPSIITGKGKDRANRKWIAAFNLDDHLETKIFRRAIPKSTNIGAMRRCMINSPPSSPAVNMPSPNSAKSNTSTLMTKTVIFLEELFPIFYCCLTILILQKWRAFLIMVKCSNWFIEFLPLLSTLV